MSRRMLCIGAVAAVAAASPVWAQTQTTVPPADLNLRRQMFTYEIQLRGAVEVGEQKLAEQAAKLAPQVTLAAVDQPVVRGFRLDGFGYFFDVQAPDIQQTILLWNMMADRGPRGQNTGPTRQVANGGVSAQGATVVADPMEGAPAFNPTKAYSQYVREAVIDAMLDGWNALPLLPDEWLVVSASGVDAPGANSLLRADKLMLRVKGSDLVDFRMGRISREQAKQRIVESRF